MQSLILVGERVEEVKTASLLRCECVFVSVGYKRSISHSLESKAAVLNIHAEDRDWTDQESNLNQ